MFFYIVKITEKLLFCKIKIKVVTIKIFTLKILHKLYPQANVFKHLTATPNATIFWSQEHLGQSMFSFSSGNLQQISQRLSDSSIVGGVRLGTTSGLG